MVLIGAKNTLVGTLLALVTASRNY